GAPELIPLLAGLIVHRLGNVQEGLFVGCTLAGLGLTARRSPPGLLILPAIANSVFFASFLLGRSLPSDPPWLAGASVSVAASLAGLATLVCGLAALSPGRSGRWSAAHVSGFCLPIAFVGLALTAIAAWDELLLPEELHAGSDSARVSSWCLAAP